MSENREQLTAPRRERPVELQLPLILLRTKRGLALLDRLGRLRASRLAGWFFLILLPFMAGLGLFLLINAVLTLAANPPLRSFAREVGPLANILLPGVNPYLPIVYGWAAIVIALIVHEGAHGVLARALGFPVKSGGLLLFLGVPIGAFVEVDDKELRKAKVRDAGRVLAAGPGTNIVVAIIALAGLIGVTSTMTPTVQGVGVVGVLEGYPAMKAGILPGDIIVEVDGRAVRSPGELTELLSGYSASETVGVKVFRRGVGFASYDVTLAASPLDPRRPILGIRGIDHAQALSLYQQAAVTSPFIHLVIPSFAESSVPFSDTMYFFYTSSLGELFQPLANLLFWIWFVNLNLAIFNALPLYPLDGGQACRALVASALKRGFEERLVRRITLSVTLTIVSLIVLMLAIPYLI